MFYNAKFTTNMKIIDSNANIIYIHQNEIHLPFELYHQNTYAHAILVEYINVHEHYGINIRFSKKLQ